MLIDQRTYSSTDVHKLYIDWTIDRMNRISFYALQRNGFTNKIEEFEKKRFKLGKNWFFPKKHFFHALKIQALWTRTVFLNSSTARYQRNIRRMPNCKGCSRGLLSSETSRLSPSVSSNFNYLLWSYIQQLLKQSSSDSLYFIFLPVWKIIL